jgi:transposase
MEVVHARCAGLDVHQKVVVVCGLTPAVVDATTGQPTPQVGRFGTMTEELIALAGWLVERGITTVAMESTGCTGSRSGTSWRRPGGSRCCW